MYATQIYSFYFNLFFVVDFMFHFLVVVAGIYFDLYFVVIISLIAFKHQQHLCCVLPEYEN